METNKQSTESKNSDFLNMFDALLGEPNTNNITKEFNSYCKRYPDNIAFVGEIYNGDIPVWKGQLDITISEDKLKAISDKLNTILNVVDLAENKTVVSFNKGKTILSLDYKSVIKRDTETKRLINIYSKK